MPKQQEDFQNAVTSILEVVMFENWLRFYFIHERSNADDGPEVAPTLVLEVPDKGMEQIRNQHPDLLPLAEAMNRSELTAELSRQAICNHVFNHLEGKVVERNRAGSIFESRSFQVKMQMFNTWVQANEAQLDEQFLDFASWRSLFAKWLETPGAKKMNSQLSAEALGRQV